MNAQLDPVGQEGDQTKPGPLVVPNQPRWYLRLTVPHFAALAIGIVAVFSPTGPVWPKPPPPPANCPGHPTKVDPRCERSGANWQKPTTQ
ncbi:Uncharacterised protein [Mycobacteroides abscessus subsp. abscessus]|nr:Uncharacterised protein [Mycobacteroides abscessus subsp. abscessus]